ncbi:MAG TPA: hypothetical protein HA263_05130 [Methanoregulaceae archaeon]|nr:hypothetical protein [Methanoregulaceae archaeon]
MNTFFSIAKTFPGEYENVIFLSVAVVDSGTFKGAAEVAALVESTGEALARYVTLAREMGFSADSRLAVGTDAVDLAGPLCRSVAEEFPHSAVFAGSSRFAGQVRLPPRDPVPAAPAQRDRLCNSAAPAVQQHHDGEHAGSRGPVNRLVRGFFILPAPNGTVIPRVTAGCQRHPSGETVLILTSNGRTRAEWADFTTRVGTTETASGPFRRLPDRGLGILFTA